MTTLDTTINTSDINIILSSVSKLLEQGSIMIDNEQISYDGIINKTLNNCTRGINSTVANNHSAGTTVQQLFTLGGSSLSSSIESTTTTITVNNIKSFTNSGTVMIDDEEITYTGISGDSMTGCIRGINNTVATSHISSVAVGQIYKSNILDLQGFTQVQTEIMSKSDGRLKIYFYNYSLGSNIIKNLNIPYVAADGYQLYGTPTFSHYVRYDFVNTNNSFISNIFYETKFLTKSVSAQILGLNAYISDTMTANLGRNINVGKTNDSNF